MRHVGRMISGKATTPIDQKIVYTVRDVDEQMDLQDRLVRIGNVL